MKWTINSNCSDDFIQAQLLRSIFILRHRQNTTKSKYLDPIAYDAKWEVFWGAVSRYTSSIIQNQDEKSYDFLTNYSLLYKDDHLDNWKNSHEGSKTKLEVGIITSEWLPLHCCVFHSTDSDEFTKVLSVESIKSKKNKKSIKAKETPLHQAVEAKNSSVTVIKNLLKYFPQMSSVQAVGGQIPLHHAANNSSSIEIIESLIQAYPQGLETKCEGREVPLFNACRNHSDNGLKIVQTLLQASPHSAKCINIDGETPLHVAIKQLECASYSPKLFEIIQVLATSYPEMLTIHDNNGETPLHVAIKQLEYDSYSPKLVEIIHVLATFCPEMLTIQDINGETPLHILCDYSFSEEINSLFRVLLDLGPTAAAILSNERQTPLHSLLFGTNGDGKDLNIHVPMLLDVYPEALAVKDKYDCFPIHYAMMNDLDLDLSHIVRMINGHPAALLTAGYSRTFRNRLTPLQLSLRSVNNVFNNSKSYDKLTLVKYLYSKCPESIHILSGNNSSLLYHAMNYCNDSNKVQIVKAVYHMDPTAAMSVNTSGETPVCSAINSASYQRTYPSADIENIRFLMRMCPAAFTHNTTYASSLIQKAVTSSNCIKGDIHRILLQAMPGGNERELCRWNYKARRMAMFLFFSAIFKDEANDDDKNGTVNIFTRLRKFDSHIIRRIILLL